MQNSRVFIVAAVALFVAACSTTPWQPPAPAPAPAAPAAAQLAGTWVLTTQSPMGARDSDAIFAQAGEQLTGKIVSSRGEVPITGSVKGAAVAFGMSVNVQGQQLQIDYSGTVTGDTMGGTVVFGSFGEGKWTGKRKIQ
jgi:hypothetical protein